MKISTINIVYKYNMQQFGQLFCEQLCIIIKDHFYNVYLKLFIVHIH